MKLARFFFAFFFTFP
ncbi:hypothetical protein CTQ56_004028 [Salmonella enterica subsp. houtenae]|uniref:Uncharacterized protein n=36 Tax=Salmonella enterica TaxID=28901 RepID=A0A5Y2QL72_SALER|nr:pheA operon leader peptide PheL [Salmonella enterica]AXC69771.1 hypothetical protein DOE63_13240 [Salmonella enterica subsp. diarizonae serovar 59:z10:-]EAA4082408.1 hypothetical protein [Salmonella enterica subsp. salamae serovar Sofia]EAA7932702.1 hypothetical protein [Salmonella enterica subsp. enterica serovar Redlands]EAU5131958.1 hypothetical protein [Salmonella enterica subsp. enterica serovar Oranienburg]EBE3719886.1 hypothetical protein [Salmonella enterica subsp. diarizonae serova